MKKLSMVLTACVATLLALNSCSKFTNKNSDSETQTDAAQVKQGQLVVKFKDDVSTEDEKNVLSQFQTIEVLDQEHRIYLVQSQTVTKTERLKAQSISEMPGVEFAEPNYVIQTHAEKVPQDPFWLKLWGLRNYGQDAPSGIEGKENADIGASTAWMRTTGDKSVVVAIVDTGIDYTHPDLAENIWVNQKEKEGIPGVDDDGNGYVDDIHGWDVVSDGRTELFYGQVGDPDPMDDNSHGTHVAGTIGARGGNGIGVVGVNWKVSLMGVKFLDENGSGSSVDEYRALKYILANNVDVVNGSYGGGGKSKLIEFALREAEKKGVLFVFAAGNDSTDNDQTPSYPANYDVPNILSVAATDSRDYIAEFSNYGQRTVHLAAPGVNILSTVPMKLKTDQPYDVYSGTSMATPHVTGAAALLIAAEPGLKKQPALIKERLMKTAEYKPHLASLVVSGGRLSISRALANETGHNNLLDGTWQSVDYPVATPEYAREKLDQSWEIMVPGAKALRIHVKFAQIDTEFDSAMIYDQAYRPIFKFGSEVLDSWSPVIMGEKAYLKFSNALVAVDGGTPFANFNSAGVIIDRVEYLK